MRSTIFPSVVLTLALPVAAAAQGVADRVTAPAAAPAQPGAFDRVLDLVLPVPATEPPHAERLGEFVMNTIGPVPLVGEAVGAAFSQASNSPKEWGQGWNAYGKRFGSNLAYNGVRQTITFAGSNLLREDTRYFASRSDGFLPRARHALVSTFTARRANGHDVFSASATAGVIGASAASSLWGPASFKGAGNIAGNAGISFASTAVSNFIREFLPDVFRRPRK